MLQHLFYEIVGVALLALTFLMMRIAKPVDGRPAAFLARSEKVEVAYALATLFLLAGGFAAMLLGFTT